MVSGYVYAFFMGTPQGFPPDRLFGNIVRIPDRILLQDKGVIPTSSCGFHTGRKVVWTGDAFFWTLRGLCRDLNQGDLDCLIIWLWLAYKLFTEELLWPILFCAIRFVQLMWKSNPSLWFLALSHPVSLEDLLQKIGDVLIDLLRALKP